ncbi:MAG TPA: zf-HC2 domain-containing protein [Solirubrobacteraceae bacterium]|nr:zf-HC2 domain-containing protein [Solirubrobacteraceae bacterium]
MHSGEHLDEVTCQEFVELVTDYFEGALPARTQNLVEEHLVMCHFCRDYADQMRTTMAALSELRGDPPVDEPSDAVLAALSRRRKAE